jgi:hypothetical protein
MITFRREDLLVSYYCMLFPGAGECTSIGDRHVRGRGTQARSVQWILIFGEAAADTAGDR